MTDATNVSWDDILSNYSEMYDNVPAGGSWSPPDGEYTVALTDVRTGTDDDGIPSWQVFVQILDGDETTKDKTFRAWWFSAKQEFSMQQFKGLAKMLNGGEIAAGIREADAVLRQAKDNGTALRIKVGRSKKGYTNCYAQEVISGGATGPAPF